MGTRSRIENLQERIRLRSGLSDETPETDDYPRISDEDAEALLEFSKQLDLLSSEYRALLNHQTASGWAVVSAFEGANCLLSSSTDII